MYSRSAKGGEKADPNRNPWLAKMDHNLNNQPEKAGRQPKSDQRTGTVFRSGRPSHVQSNITSSMILIESRISSARQAGIDEALMKLLVEKSFL